MRPFVDIAGRVAVVTGAASGIGRATARLFAELGAVVVATDLDMAGLETTCAGHFDGSITALRHDVTSEADWRAVFEKVHALGRLDVLVNNAGVMLAGEFEDAPIEHLRKQYEINVAGPFIGMQGAIEIMRTSMAEHGARPSIINVSSIFGQVSGARYAAYSASKGALKMLSKAVANELASTGIRVNSIHPGPTVTALGTNHAPLRDAAGEPISAAVAVANWVRLIPMGRLGSVDDIAPVIVFLASDAAGYITGAEIVIDGGYTSV